MPEPTVDSRYTGALLLWIGIKLFLLIALLDASETIVLYQNY